MAVVRHERRVVSSYLGLMSLNGLHDARVQRLPIAPELAIVGGLLHQGVLEDVFDLRERAAAKEHLGLDQALQRRSQLRGGVSADPLQQRERKLASQRTGDARDLLGLSAGPAGP